MRKTSESRNFIKNAESHGAVHTHTHTQIIIEDRKNTKKLCLYMLRKKDKLCRNT